MSFQIEADYRAQFERQPSRRLPLARRFPIGSALRRLRLLLLAPVMALLSACDLVVLKPAGDVAAQQGDLLMISTLLMLIIILPVMALIVFFAWKYRASNKDAEYQPEWDHSTSLELVIWAAPLLIIICLGALTWAGTHLLDPYRPIDRIKPGQAVAENVEPLQVNVVALDWKWMFIYPQYGVATVNELAAPVDRPIRFHITSSSVMNSFYIPALAGQIYAMPGMETKLHAVITARANTKASRPTIPATASRTCASPSTVWTRPASTAGSPACVRETRRWTATAIWNWKSPARRSPPCTSPAWTGCCGTRS